MALKRSYFFSTWPNCRLFWDTLNDTLRIEFPVAQSQCIPLRITLRQGRQTDHLLSPNLDKEKKKTFIIAFFLIVSRLFQYIGSYKNLLDDVFYTPLLVCRNLQGTMILMTGH